MDEKIQINVIRSKRKTMSLEIKEDSTVLVRAPFRMADTEIQRFVQEKSEWIEKHLQIQQEKKKAVQQEGRLTMQEIQELADRALAEIPKRVAYYAQLLQVDYGRITIRNQKSRWGSCSSKGNLNFNCLLMLTPPEIIDYVVVHELCHRKEMSHSARFWNEVEKVLPDYRERRAWLKEHGGRLIARMTM